MSFQTKRTMDDSKSYEMIIGVLTIAILVLTAIALPLCLLRLVDKSQNQTVCVITMSNLVNNVNRAEDACSDLTPEVSSSIRQEFNHVPSVPKSLPSYSECEFNQSFHSSTHQEPPSYEEAVKLNWI